MMNKNHNNYLKETPSHLFAGREDEAGKRLGEIIKSCNLSELSNFKAVIIGIAEYAGILRNGGKIVPPGSKVTSQETLNALYQNGAPKTVRERLYSMTEGAFEYKVSDSLAIGDLGDVCFTQGDVEGALSSLHEILVEVYQNGIIPIVIGGGHHISVSSIGAMAELHKNRSIGTTVVDAHSDYRPLKDGLIHSGIPFRYLMENYRNFRGEHFVEIGLRPERNTALYIEELRARGAQLIPLDDVSDIDIRRLIQVNEKADQVFLSVDIDAFDLFGASASYPGGMSASIGRNIAFLWGSGAKTMGMDLVEINPLIHPDSSDLGAQIIWSFLAGLSKRIA